MCDRQADLFICEAARTVNTLNIGFGCRRSIGLVALESFEVSDMAAVFTSGLKVNI